jgi:hypothetical protein
MDELVPGNWVDKHIWTDELMLGNWVDELMLGNWADKLVPDIWANGLVFLIRE